jgi:periplasmic protein TonB
MKKRKISRTNYENNKLVFFQIGMIIALLCTLYAFEYKSYEKYEIPEFENSKYEVPEVLVIQTRHTKPPPPPPPPIRKIKVDISNKEESPDIEINVHADPTTEVPVVEKEFQLKDEVIEEIPLIHIPEEQPSFPGGYAAMMNYLKENIKYPKSAREFNVTGMVYLRFVVEKDGTVSNITVLRGIGSGCDEEAIRVINIMPNWNCGKQNGMPVRVMMTLPVKFSLL